MPRLTPREKKQMSYALDRRNQYGENDKASRKNIPRGKRHVNRANRRLIDVLMVGAEGGVDLDRAEAVECKARGRRPQRWTKVPDVPLGDVVTRRRKQKR